MTLRVVVGRHQTHAHVGGEECAVQQPDGGVHHRDARGDHQPAGDHNEQHGDSPDMLEKAAQHGDGWMRVDGEQRQERESSNRERVHCLAAHHDGGNSAQLHCKAVCGCVNVTAQPRGFAAL